MYGGANAQSHRMALAGINVRRVSDNGSHQRPVRQVFSVKTRFSQRRQCDYHLSSDN